MKKVAVRCIARARLPTKYGLFHLFLYHDNIINDKKDHIALVRGNVINKRNVLTRIHSECLTGDVFDSMRCDCAEQLHHALQAISKSKEGILLYLRQEGRGIGLINKILAYKLQDEGLNTITANKALGLPVDSRDYSLAIAILEDLKIKSIKLLTNNPKKIEIFKSSKIPCVKRVPIEIEANPHNIDYLHIKRNELGHLLKLDEHKSGKAAQPDLENLKLIYFFDDTLPNFDLSNFSGKGNYSNQYGDKGTYSEITYQACKFAYLQNKKVSRVLKNKYYAQVNTPEQAYEFMKKKWPELDHKSINSAIKQSTWLSINSHNITNKELDMLYCLLDKFDAGKNPSLHRKLLKIVRNQEVILVEANPDDSYWGYKNISKSRLGTNRLGLMLTAIANVTAALNQERMKKIDKKKHISLFINKYRELVQLFDGYDFQAL